MKYSPTTIELLKSTTALKAFASERLGDDQVAEELLTHVHDGAENSPSKILLTTRSSDLPSISSQEDRIFIFNKPDEATFGFSFDEGTYRTEVFVNGFINIDPVTIVDNGDTITITFPDRLDSSDTVTIVLVINGDQNSGCRKTEDFRK